MREKKEINIQIGERVKLAREQAKLTQEQLAEYIEVSSQYISDLERGVVGISIATLKRLCMTLHISSDQILFATKSNNNIEALMEKCSNLPKEQFEILSEIINKFIEAINIEGKRMGH
ncbi:MAG: helix-turn-helix transcriptional regulator [Clostridiales bacterium]|nr:helix-turn-helix transcriptional regulator [Clostridiales bacterium]